MPEQNNGSPRPEPKYTKNLAAGSKTYYFEIREPKSGKGGDYLQVAEMSTHDGKRYSNRITVFSDHLTEFFDALEEIKEKISAQS